MEPIKIRDFKGLVTNIDSKDASPEYLKEAKNVIFRPGLVKSIHYALTPKELNGLTLTGDIVWYGKIYLDDDKYAVDKDRIKNEFIPIYSEATEVYELLIERVVFPDFNKYNFYLRLTSWNLQIDCYDLFNDLSKSTQEITVFNTDGIVKIFLPHENLWLGKINRHYRIPISAPGTPYPNPFDDENYFQGIIIDRLIESFDVEDKRIGIQFDSGVMTAGSIGNTRGKFIINKIKPVPQFPGLYAYFCNLIDANGIKLKNYGWAQYRLDNNQTVWTGTVFEGEDLDNSFMFWGTQISSTIPNVATSSQFEYNGVVYVSIIEGSISAEYQMWGGWHRTVNGELNTFNFLTSSGKTVANAGFENLYSYVELLATVFMDRAEFVTTYSKIILPALSGNFALKLYNITTIPDCSVRTTGFALYIRLQGQTDFEQFYYANAQSKTEIYYEEIYVGREDPNGFYLNQMIGVVFEPDRYRLLKGFQDYKEVSGVAYALKANKIYFPAVGNGLIQNDIFYPNFTVPGFYAEEIIKLTDVGKYLGVHTSRGLQIVMASDSRTGTFLFSIKDTAGYVAENRNALFETLDSVVMLTKRGIFITNGSQDLLISSEINDVVEATYQSGIIFIDETNKLLYYVIKGTSEIYLYDYLERKWASVELSVFPNTVERIYLGKDNEVIIYLSNKILYTLDVKNTGEATITTHLINLQQPNLLKVVERITIDFIGKIIFAGEEIASLTRRVKKFDMSLDNRIPSESFDVSLKLIDDTTLYLIQIDPDIIGESPSSTVEELNEESI